MKDWQQAKEEIREIDRRIAALFAQRMRASSEVAAYKKAHGIRAHDGAWEEECRAALLPLIEDDIAREYYDQLLAKTLSLTNAYEERLLKGRRVAYSGTVGAFAHMAAEKLFPSAEKVACPDFASAYAAVESGVCDSAVLPLENSHNGEVAEVSDLLFAGALSVSAITELAITQDLLAVPGATLADIKTVVSHPQALGQCAAYINEHGFGRREYENTALAARYVTEKGDKSIAAIASAEAAAIFGLTILARNINESPHNTTRFAVLTRTLPTYPEGEGGLHSMLMFTVRNEAGALCRAIDVIGQHGFNMIGLRSRNRKDLLFRYYFFVEIEGNIESEKGKAMFAALAEYCEKVKVVGIFRGNIPH